MSRRETQANSEVRMQRTVTIIEDHAPTRASFTDLLSSAGFSGVHAYASCEEALNQLENDKPDLVLMDIGLPGMSGIEGTRQIRERLPACLILMVTVHDPGDLVFRAFAAGTVGYIVKTTDHTLILKAIEEAFAGGAPMSAQISRMVIESFQKRYDSPLTKRELEILQLISQGMTYTRIASKLYISKDTVKTHIRNIYRKLEVSSKEQALRIASNERWIGTSSEHPDDFMQ